MTLPLRVNVFPGGFNWPLFAGIQKNFFDREAVAIELQATTGSVAQMTGLAAGEFDIAMTAFDNVVAYVEGQGEAPIGPQPGFFAFLGSDDSFCRWWQNRTYPKRGICVTEKSRSMPRQRVMPSRCSICLSSPDSNAMITCL